MLRTSLERLAPGMLKGGAHAVWCRLEEPTRGAREAGVSCDSSGSCRKMHLSNSTFSLRDLLKACYAQGQCHHAWL